MVQTDTIGDTLYSYYDWKDSIQDIIGTVANMESKYCKIVEPKEILVVNLLTAITLIFCLLGATLNAEAAQTPSFKDIKEALHAPQSRFFWIQNRRATSPPTINTLSVTLTAFST